MSIIQAEIEELQEKQKWLDLAHKLAAEAGYDTYDDAGERALLEAIDSASLAHARSMGDGPYKPVDYDFCYPESEDTLRAFVKRECARRNIAKLPPELDMKAELRLLNPSYKGEGGLQDAFCVAVRVLDSGSKDDLDDLERLACKLKSRKEPEFKAFGGFISAGVDMRRSL